MREVWQQLRKAFYGDTTSADQEGGWKPADCGNLVRHAFAEMNAWIRDHGRGLLSGTIGKLKVHGFDKHSETVGGEVEDGVGEEMEDELREDDCVEIEP